MAFTSIVIVIVVIYVFGYAGMIVYDLFLKKEPVEFMPKPKDVDIDISDEAGRHLRRGRAVQAHSSGEYRAPKACRNSELRHR